jgi:glycosyltransferase involved in cell wall biosynthesis
MNIVLATGIYPPDIGGPATYVRNLARELTARGHDVTVITFGDEAKRNQEDVWKVIYVAKGGGPFVRWSRYAKALKTHAQAAEVIECFSSVSAGVPLRLARLKLPKKILRLGGDFAWERYTDLGRRRTLREFTSKYAQLRSPMNRLIGSFDYVIFSTAFQQKLCEDGYSRLPKHSVIQNALPKREIVHHEAHHPFRILYFGRFVHFKNLDRLLRAVAGVPHMTLTLVGDGPLKAKLSAEARKLELHGRVSIVPPVHGPDAEAVFAEHDLLVIPSITEISPNAALEARACGLPVLLSEENGLSEELRDGMIIRKTISTTDITRAILEASQKYPEIAAAASAPFTRERGWDAIADEHEALFQSLVA